MGYDTIIYHFWAAQSENRTSDIVKPNQVMSSSICRQYIDPDQHMYLHILITVCLLNNWTLMNIFKYIEGSYQTAVLLPDLNLYCLNDILFA